nr:uncharacterized protein LOC113840747 isoform X15 [Anas platyrhynchos]
MRASGCGPGSDGHRKLTAQPPAEPQASAPLALAQSKAETRSRRCFPKAAPKKMLGQAPWARLSPSGPAVLLLALCAGVTTQDICSSPGLQEHGGNDQTPVLYLNASTAKEGEIILFQCAIDWQFPATRVVFCKNGLEEFSLKAQQGKVIYALVLNITSRSAGTYKCGYQQRNESNWVRNSALSAPQTLSVAGSSPSHKAQLPSRGETLLISPSQHSCPPRLALATLCSSSLPGSAMSLEVWILRSALSLLLLLSAPIITLLLER